MPWLKCGKSKESLLAAKVVETSRTILAGMVDSPTRFSHGWDERGEAAKPWIIACVEWIQSQWPLGVHSSAVRAVEAHVRLPQCVQKDSTSKAVKCNHTLDNWLTPSILTGHQTGDRSAMSECPSCTADVLCTRTQHTCSNILCALSCYRHTNVGAPGYNAPPPPAPTPDIKSNGSCKKMNDSCTYNTSGCCSPYKCSQVFSDGSRYCIP